jgi:hypothetical protein
MKFTVYTVGVMKDCDRANISKSTGGSVWFSANEAKTYVNSLLVNGRQAQGAVYKIEIEGSMLDFIKPTKGSWFELLQPVPLGAKVFSGSLVN